jgi:hypothetical protein
MELIEGGSFEERQKELQKIQAQKIAPRQATSYQ